MNAKKSKLIRKLMRLKDVDPRHAEYYTPVRERVEFTAVGPRMVPVVMPWTLVETCGRARYKALKSQSLLVRSVTR